VAGDVEDADEAAGALDDEVAGALEDPDGLCGEAPESLPEPQSVSVRRVARTATAWTGSTN
jgi:hypothetical protein